VSAIATSAIIVALKKEGCFTAADWVSHGYLPGQTVARLHQIYERCKNLEMVTAANVISRFLKEEE